RQRQIHDGSRSGPQSLTHVVDDPDDLADRGVPTDLQLALERVLAVLPPALRHRSTDHDDGWGSRSVAIVERTPAQQWDLQRGEVGARDDRDVGAAREGPVAVVTANDVEQVSKAS